MGFSLGRTLCALTWGTCARIVTSEGAAYTLAGESCIVGEYPNGMPAPCASPLADASACSAAASDLGLTFGGESPTCVNATVRLWRDGEAATDYSYTGSFELWTYDTTTDLKVSEVLSATLAANNVPAISYGTAELFTVCLAPGAYAGCAYVNGSNSDSDAFNWEVESPNGEVSGETAATASSQTSCGDQGSFTVALTTGCYRQDDSLFFRDSLPYGESCGMESYCICESVDATRYELQVSGTCATAISTADGYNATDCARAFELTIEGGLVEREQAADTTDTWPCEATAEGCGPVWVVVDSGSPPGCFYEADLGAVYFNNDETTTAECSANLPCICLPVPDPTSQPTWLPSTSPSSSPTVTYAPTTLIPPTPMPTTDDTTLVAGSFGIVFDSYPYAPDATDFINIKAALSTQLGLDDIDSDGELTAFNISTSANRRRLLGLGRSTSSSASSSSAGSVSSASSAGNDLSSVWRSLASSGVTWTVSFTLKEGFRQVNGASAADLLASVTSVLNSTAFTTALSQELASLTFSVTGIVTGVVTPFPTAQPTLEPSPMPTVVPTPGGDGIVAATASSSVLLIVIALVKKEKYLKSMHAYSAGICLGDLVVLPLCLCAPSLLFYKSLPVVLLKSARFVLNSYFTSQNNSLIECILQFFVFHVSSLHLAKVGGICFAASVGLCLAKRRSDAKHRAEYEDALVNAEGNIGLTIVRTGPAARAKAPRGSNGASVNVYVIPFENLKLEARPFAQGGGGMVFQGSYSGNKVAAKQVKGFGVWYGCDEINVDTDECAIFVEFVLAKVTLKENGPYLGEEIQQKENC